MAVLIGLAGVQGQTTKDLLDTERVSLYWINFDVNSDFVRDESEPTLVHARV